MIGIGHWHYIIASILQFFLEHVADEKFVFDDQDSWHGDPTWGYHRPRLRANKYLIIQSFRSRKLFRRFKEIAAPTPQGLRDRTV